MRKILDTTDEDISPPDTSVQVVAANEKKSPADDAGMNARFDEHRTRHSRDGLTQASRGLMRW